MQTPYASRLKPPCPRKTNITHTPYTGSCTPHTLARRTRARRIVHIHSAERHTLRRHGPPWSSCVGLRANPVVSYSTSASLSLRVRSPALTCPLSSPRFRHHTTRTVFRIPATQRADSNMDASISAMRTTRSAHLAAHVYLAMHTRTGIAFPNRVPPDKERTPHAIHGPKLADLGFTTHALANGR